jgi:hypothetical protein
MDCGARSDEFALHVLGLTQGVAMLANAFQDEAYVEREVRRIREWMESCARDHARRPGRKSAT